MYVRFLPVHDAQELLPHVLCPLERAHLDKILIAPGIRKLVVLPRVVDSEEGEVVALCLVELGLLLVCQCLLLFGPGRGRGRGMLVISYCH